MRTLSRFLSLSLVLGVTMSPAMAAPVAPAAPTVSAPARRNPPIYSPELSADRRVVFRLRAAEAKVVAVQGQWSKEKLPLVRDADGLWSGTFGPIEPGVWEYSFVVDGLVTLDSANAQAKPQRWPKVSILEIPASPPALTEFQDVPHGTLHVHQYRSRAAGGQVRRMHVYTPPGYENKPGPRLPVLYLLHGYSDNDGAWSAHGRAHFIVDNLLAQKKVQPMIVVMTDGHVLAPEKAEKDTLAHIPDNTVAYQKDLLEEVLPLVERTYRIRSDSGGRALVGLSMGGNQSLTIGLGHSDKFAWVGGFSSAAPEDDKIAGALADVAKLNKQLTWLWVGCGKDDFLLKRNQAFIETLAKKQVKHTWRLTEGAHSWPVWRAYLIEILPQLFVKASAKK